MSDNEETTTAGPTTVTVTTSVSLQPPEKFDFKNPDGWRKWKCRFEQFLSASGLDSKQEARKVSTLLYCLGDEAEDVLTSTNITEDERKTYEAVIDKFDQFFQVRKNVIYERARFNRRDQKEGESAETYITELYRLAESCEYGEMKKELLRDRLVVGIRDTQLSEKLQMDPKLTLEAAKKSIRQKEAVKQQSKSLQSCNDADAISSSKKNQRKHRGHQGKPPHHKGGASLPTQHKGGASLPSANQSCMRCGKGRHPTPELCPARKATCNKCNRKGHYSSQCLSKTKVKRAPTDEVQDDAFLGTIRSSEGRAWLQPVMLEGTETTFKLNTGAEVTVISDQTFSKLKKMKLEKPSRVLYGPSRHSLELLGQFKGQLTHGNRTVTEEIFVAKGLRNNLLGLPAITSLKLIQRLDTVSKEFTGIQAVKQKFPNLFKGLGTMAREYTIKLKDDAVPRAIYTPRKIPFPLRDKVQQELKRMEAIGVISKVTTPTPWCAGMVAVPKKSGAVRICVDLKPLNESVKREVHPIPKVDETLAKLAGATVFTKRDANSGYWQIPLAEESRLLTTFVTPFGRFCFNKLPFGISSAPELFQRRMNEILDGLDGVVCQIDDTLIFGKDEAEHDARLAQALKRIADAGATLNEEKCEFKKSSVKFLGHVVDKDGVRPDPNKTAAIQKMEAPKSVSELRRFLGMVNQLGKFSPRIADITQPMRELLSTKRAWLWGPEHDAAFEKVKLELSQPTVLALYNPRAEMKVSADASSFGLGAVLFQKVEDKWKPVVYASRSMTETETRYAQIEKEALATTWACEKFQEYILGRKFSIESDHKPLIPLLSTKDLDSMPPRILRFRLRLARFDYTIRHVPGKEMYTADTLSRSPVGEEDKEDMVLQGEVETFIASVVKCLPATEQGRSKYSTAQQQDSVCQQLQHYCRKGWPAKTAVSPEIAPYWKEKGSLTESDQLLLYNHRIVVPKSLQKETLQKLHEGHQGMERCRARAAASVWWPGLSQQITQTVQDCYECAKHATPNREPLIATKLPEYPWQIVGTDLFEIKGVHYLLVVDYFSRYPEVLQMNSTTSAAVISALKSVFARHGIPEVVRSDNGPQYSSQEFSRFAEAYEFSHVTSSPRFPQSNGQAERMVQTVKRMLQRSSDLHLALLSYRATPLPWCDLSPSELCMGRRVRTLVPQVRKQLIPNWPYLQMFKRKNKHFKKNQKKNFDKEHRVKEQTQIPDNTEVWITSESEPVRGHVVSSSGQPRSYVVQTPNGQVHHNRSHLNIVPQQTPQTPEAESSVPNTTTTKQSSPQSSPPNRIMTRRATGTQLRQPNWLTY